MSRVEFPKPFGWLRDGGEGGALVFQREPLTEMQNLAHSTAAVYRSQDVESYAAARVAEAREAQAAECARWKEDAAKLATAIRRHQRRDFNSDHPALDKALRDHDGLVKDSKHPA